MFFFWLLRTSSNFHRKPDHARLRACRVLGSQEGLAGKQRVGSRRHDEKLRAPHRDVIALRDRAGNLRVVRGTVLPRPRRLQRLFAAGLFLGAENTFQQPVERRLGAASLERRPAEARSRRAERTRSPVRGQARALDGSRFASRFGRKAVVQHKRSFSKLKTFFINQ